MTTNIIKKNCMIGKMEIPSSLFNYLFLPMKIIH
jgi:hypothetical protein